MPDLERTYLRKNQANNELVTLLKTTGTGLLNLHGIGPPPSRRRLDTEGSHERTFPRERATRGRTCAPGIGGFSPFATALSSIAVATPSTLHNERVPTPMWVQRTASW